MFRHARRAAALASLGFVAAVLATQPAAADHVTFVFRGTVTNVFDGLPIFGGSIGPGTSFDGWLTFDTDTAGVPLPATAGEGFTYAHTAPPARVRIRFDDFVLRSVPSAPDIHVTVLDDSGGDMLDALAWHSANNEALGLHPRIDYFLFDFELSNPGGTPLASAELPVEPPDVTAFASNTVRLWGACSTCSGPDEYFIIDGTLTALEHRGRSLHPGGDGSQSRAPGTGTLARNP